MLTIARVSSKSGGKYSCVVVEREDRSNIVERLHEWLLVVIEPADIPRIANGYGRGVQFTLIVRKGNQNVTLDCSASSGNAETEVETHASMHSFHSSTTRST